jgi:Lrp/AsnC family transcriptional regulator for asnA, asnC and gidA
MLALDETDYKILEMLREDARIPYTEIASKLGVSDSTIHVRLKKLKEEGVIKAYTIKINEELIGKKVHGLAMINISLGHLNEVAPKLASIDNVVKVYETHGNNDLAVIIDAQDLDGLREVLMQIRMIENITSTSLTTILKIWK